LGKSDLAPEGRFLPDTYHFSKGSSDLDLLKRAATAMDKHLATAWQNRDLGLPLKNANEALVLASIVEKETGLSSDRRMIASVFHNRLRIQMPLQTDPTVIYGLGASFDGNLRRADLQSDHPWNTYVHKGLLPWKPRYTPPPARLCILWRVVTVPANSATTWPTTTQRWTATNVAFQVARHNSLLCNPPAYSSVLKA
jgi:uncharacterized YceG family protein